MSLAVLDWRREVAALYAEVRAAPDPAEGHIRWRTRREELIATHPASPVPAGDRASRPPGVYGAYDPDLRFVCEIDELAEPSGFSVETGTDGTVSFARLGRVRLGKLGTLDVWWHTGYGGGLFLPMRDASPRTYGGGRYLLDTTKGADLGGRIDLQRGGGQVVVDLNFAYNPSCAYDPSWACPLAPPSNVLEVGIEVGELTTPEA